MNMCRVTFGGSMCDAESPALWGAMTSMAYLLVQDGSETGVRFELKDEETTIGRHPDCGVVLKEAGRVSRHHARIVRRGDEFFVEDLGSRNGTRLNGNDLQRDKPYPLTNGDCVTVCDMDLVFKQKKFASTFEIDRADIAATVGTVMFDDDDADSSSSSTVMSKLDVSSASDGVLQVTASLEARLSALIEITRSLGKALSLDEVLPQVLNTLFKIFLQADRGFIVLQDDDGRLIPRWAENRNQNADETIRISRTIVRHVMESKEAILSADATRDFEDMSQSIADLRIRSMMCAPLLDSEGNAQGVMQIDTLDQRKRFRQEDLEVLASVALQAGIAIDNTRLHENELRRKEIEQDLEIAREVQEGFLPQSRPDISGYEFFDFYRPANHVGGDYYDYIPLPDGRTAVIVADVVGHGIAAAMMMAKLSAEAKFCLATENNPAAAITKLNDRFTSIRIDRFVTLIMGVLDPVNHEVTIVNAGHMPPIWRRTDNTIEEPGGDVSGLPVGIVEGMAYKQIVVPLADGESLTMYTDGINEAIDEAGKQFSIDRIRNHVKTGSQELEVVGQAIVDDVRQFVGEGPQADDMCIVCLGRQ